MNELLQRATEAERRQSNFIMAASGACIAYALNQLGDAAFSCDKLVLFAALFFWAFSFFVGCAYASYAAESERMRANDLAAIKSGFSPYLKRLYEGAEGIASGRWQDWMYKIQHASLFLGVLFYIGWRGYSMYLSTVKPTL
ncbi:MAG: hypothetical protein ACI4QS_10840 [Comamonas sp.]